MTASMTDLFTKVGDPGTLTALQAPGKAIGATSILLTSPVNWPTTLAVYFSIQRINVATNTVVPGSYTVWKGILNGSSIDSLVLEYGVDQAYSAGEGVQVFIYVNTTWANSLIDGLLVNHNPDGSHKMINSFIKQIADATVPVATERAYFGTKATFDADTASVGWLFPEENIEYLQADYPRLHAHFSIVDTSFIVSPTKFKFPAKYFGTLRLQRKPSDTDFDTLGKSGGEKTHVLTSPEMPSHTHTVGIGGANTNFSPSAGAGIGSINGAQNTGNTGNGNAHNNLQPYLTLNYIIKT